MKSKYLAIIVIAISSVFAICVSASSATSKQILLEVYGDSTSLGAQTINGVLTTTPNSEPNQLQDLLQARFGKNITVINNGVGGTQAYQLLSGTDGRNRAWSSQMAKSNADIVIINYALNDQMYNVSPPPGMFQETPETYGNIISWIIQTARDNGKIVVLQEPNPTCYQPTVGNLYKFVTALRNTATLMNAPLVAAYDHIQTIPNWKSMLSDCAHPNDQLYGIKAGQTFKALTPIIDSIIN